MKCILLMKASLAILALTQALPQKLNLKEELPNRAVIEDTVSTNPNGGLDVSLKATKPFGNDRVSGFSSIFAEGNTKTGGTVAGATLGAASLNPSGKPTNSLAVSVQKSQDSISESFRKQAEANLKLGDTNTLTGRISQIDTKFKGIDFRPQQTSSSVSWKNDYGIGASISRDINKGVSDTLTKSVSANIFNRGDHRLDGTFFKSIVVQDNGFRFDKTGGLLDYSHNNGHGLSAGLTRFSGIGQQASLSGHANQFTSNDGLTKLNANAGASKWLNGPYTSQRDYSFGLGLSHNGWRG